MPSRALVPCALCMEPCSPSLVQLDELGAARRAGRHLWEWGLELLIRTCLRPTAVTSSSPAPTSEKFLREAFRSRSTKSYQPQMWLSRCAEVAQKDGGLLDHLRPLCHS